LFSKPSSPGLRLKGRRKHITTGGEVSTRVKSVQDTLTEIIPLCKKIGVTRISDITFMDKLYIPNYSAILPGTEDLIWVYSGKGTTKPHAKASALMEAIERYSSLSGSYHRAFIQGSYLQLSKSYNKVLHPDEVVESTNQEYNDKYAIMDFLPGFDLLTNEKVLVPAEIALYRYSPKDPAICAFSHFHTNGLASGNVLEEAICHALCEVIERDAISIADLCASCIPYNILEKIMDSLKNEETGKYPAIRIPAEDKFVDDSSIFPDVDISEIAEEFDPIKRLVKRFTDVGIPLLIKDITQKDVGIPTFVASSIEWITNNYGYFAKGYGTHPDARIALIRAITEVSQTRAGNVQGARDDLKKIEYREDDEIYKRKWQFMPASSSLTRQNRLFDNKNIIKFSEIKTHMNEDILDDIHIILYSLKKAGLKRAIIVDLTNPDIGIPVVRAIVPGFETFEVTKSIMGRRAKQYFRRLYHS
jgi:ribosomal protein S12 methylthiotransferase accessory factor YcaO